MNKLVLIAAVLLISLALAQLAPLPAFAEGNDDQKTEAPPAEMTKEERDAAIKKFENSLAWKTGEVTLPNGLAKLNLPAEFRYLDANDALRVLQAWGNAHVSESQGMLFPADLSPLNEQAWGVLISYDGDGHVADDDAKKIDYNELLKNMQESIAEGAEARKEANEPEVALVGWATAPKYDEASHKMYWAKELRFADNKENTLNYNIRVLGREGVLVLNAVATMKQLPLIEKETPRILSFVDFTDGNRYADYKPGTHKLAGYGLTGLVAGGLAVSAAAKTGLFKVALTALLAGKKFVIIGVVAALAGLRAFLRRRKDGDSKAT